MSDQTIHHINISYDESHERIRDFVQYLQGEHMAEEMKAYYEEAKHSPDGKIHLNDRFGNEFTLHYLGGFNCELRLRGM